MNYRFAAVALFVCFCASSAFAALIPDRNEKGKYGYVDESGTVVLKHNYNEAYPFADGMAKVRKGNKWGFIDSQGKEIIEIKYSEIGDWYNGFCKVASGGKLKDDVLTGAKYGFIDKNGAEVIKPEYDMIGQFSGSVALVKKKDKYGYIDTECRFVVPCEFDGIGSPNARGWIWVNKGGNYNQSSQKEIPVPGKRHDYGGKYGVYNTQGTVVVPCEYASLGMFLTDSIVMARNKILCGGNPYSDDFSVRLVEKYFEDTQLMGNDYREKLYVTICSYEMMSCRDNAYTRDLYRSPALGCNKRHSGISRTSEWCAANTDYPLFSKLPALSLDNVSWAYAWVSNNYDGSYPGIVNLTDGTVVIESGKYEMVGEPNDFLVFVANGVGTSNMTMNWYDLSLKKELLDEDVTFDATLDVDKYAFMLSNFCDGVAEIRQYGNSRLVNSTLAQPLKQMYDYISDVYDGNLVIVEQLGMCGMQRLDNYRVSSDEVVPAIYQKLYPPTDSLMLAAKDGKYGYLSMSGKEAIPFVYDKAFKFKYGAAAVSQNGNFGLIDRYNSVIVPMQWRRVMDKDREDARYVWVAQQADSTFYAYDLIAGQVLGGGYKQVYSYFDDNGVAYATKPAEFYALDGNGSVVKRQMEALGCVTPEGEVILPFAFPTLDAAKQAYSEMKAAGKDKIDGTDGLRLAIYATDVRNKFKITDIVPEELWDY